MNRVQNSIGEIIKEEPVETSPTVEQPKNNLRAFSMYRKETEKKEQVSEEQKEGGGQTVQEGIRREPIVPVAAPEKSP